MMQQSLVDFLMQRIAEDEAVARSATPGVTALLALIVVLAECAAKRKIVELHQPDDDKCSVCSHEIGYASDGYGGEYYENHRTGDDWPCATLRALAAVYSGHPDYRQEWA